MTFPIDSYTPFGYLANPYHRARSWTEVEAGLLRSTDTFVGFGWVEPTARRPSLEASIVLLVRWNDKLYQTRSDFSRLGLTSKHHSSALFTYDWHMDAASGSLGFALASRDSLVSELKLTNSGPLPLAVEVIALGLWRADSGRWTVESGAMQWNVQDQMSGRGWAFGTSDGGGRPVSPDLVASIAPDIQAADCVAVGYAFGVRLEPGKSTIAAFGLDRGIPARLRATSADSGSAVVEQRRSADNAFYKGVALPVGDWPDTWKRGWIYDLETTRSCIYPSGGIFQDEWLSWMMPWPRVVIAEGTLDAARFSYADPSRALRLASSTFRNAPAPNVPCVFQGGEPNMVAKDGTVCGTSPAWCLPFHNLWLLYCRTMDRPWATTIIPYLEAYLKYWLTERTDEDGWVVYKCTWEAGEDCTPRLDPLAEGDEVISRWIRPVELQATLALSASVLARLCQETAQLERAETWEAVANSYAQRTKDLWDANSGRFRDWDKRTRAFLEPPGEPTYWKTDPVRFSALSLTPIVAGLADSTQLARLASEIEYYDAAPWCLWPSWSFVVAEAASVAGWHDFAGRFAGRIVDRVYAANDRRTLADASRPTPGTSPEFWPLDLAEFNGSDAYGWGATTTSLWVRQVFGFRDAEPSPEVEFTLTPSLPPEFIQIGKRYGFVGMPYRGLRFDLSYEVQADGLVATVAPDRPATIRVTDPGGNTLRIDEGPDRGSFRFVVASNRRYHVKVVLSVAGSGCVGIRSGVGGLE